MANPMENPGRRSISAAEQWEKTKEMEKDVLPIQALSALNTQLPAAPSCPDSPQFLLKLWGKKDGTSTFSVEKNGFSAPKIAH